jgi:hypothetical protein
MLRKYAGIGSRQTPEHIQKLMHQTAGMLRADGWLLRTGHATGADQAFELGGQDRTEVYLPWGDYNIDTPYPPTTTPKNGPTQQAMAIAERFHPAWDKCSPGARLLHARNSHIVLGPDCNDPVEMVVAWFDPHKTSGTQQAVRIADGLGIPVKNLYYAETVSKVCAYLKLAPTEYLV